MLVSKAEMEALKIVGVYMDAPAKILESPLGVALGELLSFGFLKHNKEHTCLRLTKAGAEILQSAGVVVKEYMPQSGRTLERRLQGSRIALFLSGLEINVLNVLLEEAPKTILKPSYLSSAEIRRQKYGNVLGMSKFLGLLYSAETTYVIYNVSDTAEIFFPQTDEDIFTREIISANNPAKILYVSDKSLNEMAELVSEHSPTETKSETQSRGCRFYQAIKRFNSPVSLVSMNESADQLRIMLTENYRQKLARHMLNASYLPVAADFVDAEFKKGYLLVFIDFDIKRLKQALSIIKSLHILVLDEQVAALETLLNGRKCNAEIYSINPQEAFEVLEIPEPVDMNLVPFKTKEGVGVIAATTTRPNSKIDRKQNKA
jgi:hypothetical protein